MKFRAYLTLLSLSIIALLAWRIDICHGASAETLSVSAQVVGGQFNYVVKSGDSLTGIGARFSVSTSVLAGANGLPLSARLQVGQELRVENRHIAPSLAGDGIVINIPQRTLFFFKEGQLRHAYPVALGKPDWPTPTGQFTIAVKEENPVWDVPQSIQEEMRREGKVVKTCVPPGPDNPLGNHWLGLSLGGYGIHGTIAPSSIYHFQTHGCIRLHPDDIAELFGEISRGTPAILVYRRLLVAQVAGRIFLEVHRDIYQKQPAITQEFDQLVRAENLEAKIDWPLASDIIRQQDGIARDITKQNGTVPANESRSSPYNPTTPRP